MKQCVILGQSQCLNLFRTFSSTSIVLYTLRRQNSANKRYLWLRLRYPGLHARTWLPLGPMSLSEGPRFVSPRCTVGARCEITLDGTFRSDPRLAVEHA